MKNVVNLSDYKKAKILDDEIDTGIDMSEEVQQIINQMQSIDEVCTRFWNDGMPPQQKIMAFYYIMNQMFTAMMLEDVEDMKEYLQKNLGTPYNDSTAAVIDSSAFGVIWDTLLAGKASIEESIDL